MTSRFDDYWLTDSVDQYASMRHVTSLSATTDDWVSLEVPFNLSLALGGIFFFVGKVDGLWLFQIFNEEVIVTGIVFFANKITINRLFPNYGYADPPLLPPLRRGHLDIKDAQWPKKIDGCKISYHIISRLGATVAQMRPNGTPEIQFSS